MAAVSIIIGIVWIVASVLHVAMMWSERDA